MARILPQKIELDKRYADRYSLAMDLSVLWWTLVIVVLRRPVSMRRRTCRLSSAEPGAAAHPERQRAREAA